MNPILTYSLIDFELDKFETYTILICFILITIVLAVIVFRELNKKDDDYY